MIEHVKKFVARFRKPKEEDFEFIEDISLVVEDPETVKLPSDDKRKRIDRDSLRFQQKEIRRQKDIEYWKGVLEKLAGRPANDPAVIKAKKELTTLLQRTRKSAIKGIQAKNTKAPPTRSEEAKLARGKQPKRDRDITKHLSFNPNDGVEIA